MTASRRVERLNELFRSEISELLRRELKDPRLGSMVTITSVQTAPDLHHARVFVSVLGSQTEQRQTIEALRHASGFLRRELASRLDLRTVPELEFRLDESIARGERILQLLREVNQHLTTEGAADQAPDDGERHAR